MFLRHLAPAFLWAVFILLLCGMPGEAIPELDFWALFQFDKIVHAGIFGIQVLILAIGLRKQHSFPFLRFYGLLFALSFGIFYGVLTEFLQLVMFSGRSFDLLDMAANIIGSFAGLLLFFLIYGRR